MAKGYWIVSIEVHDATLYGEYVKRVRPFVAARGGRFLVRGGTHEITEGAGRSRNVVIEFDSYREALDAYHSRDYQDMVKIRSGASEGSFVIAEGLDPA